MYLFDSYIRKYDSFKKYVKSTLTVSLLKTVTKLRLLEKRS